MRLDDRVGRGRDDHPPAPPGRSRPASRRTGTRAASSRRAATARRRTGSRRPRRYTGPESVGSGDVAAWTPAGFARYGMRPALGSRPRRRRREEPERERPGVGQDEQRRREPVEERPPLEPQAERQRRRHDEVHPGHRAQELVVPVQAPGPQPVLEVDRRDVAEERAPSRRRAAAGSRGAGAGVWAIPRDSSYSTISTTKGTKSSRNRRPRPSTSAGASSTRT